MFDMMKMMGKMKEVQAKIKEAQDNLHTVIAEGDAGGGMVKAVVNGKHQVVSLDIDPTILKESDRVIVQDLVIAAVNKAMAEVEALARGSLRKSTEGLIPNIPGMDLSGLMG